VAKRQKELGKRRRANKKRRKKDEEEKSWVRATV